MRYLTYSIVIALAVSACLGSDFADSVEGAWQLTGGTHAGQAVPIVDSHPITMTLESGRISGTAACNAYGGEYELSGSSFSIVEGLAVTEMACQPEEVMRSEQAFIGAIALIDEVKLTNDALLLTGPGAELRFEALAPVPTADLIDTVWILDGLVSGDAVSSPMAGTSEATLELFEDGTFHGSTGCRTISGEYEVSGAEVLFTSWVAEGECPSELAEQDSRVISALEGGFRVEIDGDRMTTWVAGDEGLIYRAGT